MYISFTMTIYKESAQTKRFFCHKSLPLHSISINESVVILLQVVSCDAGYGNEGAKEAGTSPHPNKHLLISWNLFHAHMDLYVMFGKWTTS